MLKGYKNDWSQLTGYEFSGLHWNQFIVIYAKLGESIYKHNYKEFIKHYLNDDFDEDSGPDFKKYPIGSLFLKEHFNAKDDKREEGTILTLMEKLPEGYDDEYGNWKYIWVNSQSGAIIAEGNSSNELLYSSCIECHSNMSDRDYVFATYMQPDSELATTP